MTTLSITLPHSYAFSFLIAQRKHVLHVGHIDTVYTTMHALGHRQRDVSFVHPHSVCVSVSTPSRLVMLRISTPRSLIVGNGTQNKKNKTSRS